MREITLLLIASMLVSCQGMSMNLKPTAKGITNTMTFKPLKGMNFKIKL